MCVYIDLYTYPIPMYTRRKEIGGDDDSCGPFANTLIECLLNIWLCKVLQKNITLITNEEPKKPKSKNEKQQ